MPGKLFILKLILNLDEKGKDCMKKRQDGRMKTMRTGMLVVGCLVGGLSWALAGGPGLPSRDPNLDVLPGFKNPPPGYGEVPF